MITIEDIADDVRFTEAFWCGDGAIHDSVRDPSLSAWHAHGAGRNLTRWFEAQRQQLSPASLFNVSEEDHWRRCERRWPSLMRFHAAFCSPSDPSLIYFQKTWKKMQRLFYAHESQRQSKERAEVIHEWLDTEAAFWDYLCRCRWESENEIARTTVAESDAAEAAIEPGIYNKAYNAKELREWFVKTFPEMTKEWESIWTSYWSYWRQTTLSAVSSESLPSPSPEAR